MVVPESLNILKADHPELAKVFSKEWQTPLSDYAQNLYRKSPLKLEPALISALEQELASMCVDTATIDQALDQIQRVPVLQTSHHITPTHGPTFLTLDLICLSGLKGSGPYLIGANSGVAFSNSAWSGALSYGNLPLESLVDSESRAFQQLLKSQQERAAHGDTDSRISLIPARQRDRLVFGTQLVDHQLELFRQFRKNLQVILPELKTGQSFSQWSAITAANIQNRVFDIQQVLIFDINRVIVRYLVEILTNYPDHPCSILLSDSTEGSEIRSIFKDPTIFLGLYKGKKSEKVDPLSWSGSGLNSQKKGHLELNRPELIHKLSEYELCPGIFLLFFVLRFLNGIRCLGSFNQIGYLEKYRQFWETTSVDWNLDLVPDYCQSLTTGRIIQEEEPVWPLDLIMSRQSLSIESFSDMEMGHFWQPIVNQLTMQVG